MAPTLGLRHRRSRRPQTALVGRPDAQGGAESAQVDSPQVEANLKSVKGIGACAVFAQADKDHVVVIVSQPEKGWGSVGGRPDEAMLLKELTAAMLKLVKAQEMAKFEIPKQCKVVDDQWLPDGEPALVTAALKLKRNELRTFYNAPGGPLDQMGYRFPEKKQ